MGSWFCLTENKEQNKQTHKDTKPELEKVDVVNFKLKQARDRIKTFINSKNKDLNQIEIKIADKVPAFKQTGNKKQLIPLLKAKKDLLKMIDSGEVRLNFIKQKLAEVQMQKMNADTINVLEDANKYVKQIQEHLQQKDWRQILSDATNKYQIEWPNDSQEVQEDPAFQAMWKELGGDTVAQVPQKKKAHVQIAQQQKQHIRSQEAALA